MSELVLRGISKSFGEKQVLRQVDFHAASGKLVALLGPSGCGKTTLLHIISGILKQDQGQVLIDGKDVSALPVEKRGIGVVFQNYALFEHMSVEQNVAYGLRQRRTPKEEMRKKVEEVLEMVRLAGYQKRRITGLSGGEQQRVALARAIVLKPHILLLDEPLSALDKKIRGEMQEEISRIQRETGITTLFVTHDQAEALAMADEIAIMRGGQIVEEGAPEAIYHHPSSLFAADFLGAANLICGVYQEGKLMRQGEALPAEGEFLPDEEIVLAVREEHVRLDPKKGAFPGQIRERIFLGQLTQYTLDTPYGPLKAVRAAEEEQLAPGDEVWVTFAQTRFFKNQ